MKDVQELYSKNYKHSWLIKDSDEWIRDLVSLIPQKLLHRFLTVPIKIPAAFLKKDSHDFKVYMEM